MKLIDLQESREEHAATQWGDQILAAYNKDRYRGATQSQLQDSATKPLDVVKRLSEIEPRYVQWLTKMYIAGQFKLEDISRLKHDVQRFNAVRSNLQNKDINQYKSLSDLYAALKPFEQAENISNRQKNKQLRDKLWKDGDLTEFYKDDQIRVIVPETEKAACYIGRGTKWCTSSTESENYFDHYNDAGPLYVIFTHDKRKYQLHVVQGMTMPDYEDERDEDAEYWDEDDVGHLSVMDEQDQEVDLDELVKKYPSLKKAFANMRDDWGYNFEEALKD